MMPYLDCFITVLCAPLQTSAPLRAPRERRLDDRLYDYDMISKHSATLNSDDTIEGTCLCVKTPLKPFKQISNQVMETLELLLLVAFVYVFF